MREREPIPTLEVAMFTEVIEALGNPGDEVILLTNKPDSEEAIRTEMAKNHKKVSVTREKKAERIGEKFKYRITLI